ncbi:RpiB/LacA/LacB family sugar-phosphate isomerase [Patescibacteria group bacterium]|nr:RpiB/LacA/LacB family sugar-phosphate isomerase [Patescibacteria group bacterium]MBU1885736.1 RpiB/LacA/LacB family sugar-phosphate isomerase [Patescibacteria group bacterium]
MKIYLGADHRGFELKEQLRTWLQNQGFEVIDCGNAIYDPDDDFSDFAFKVAHRVSLNPDSRGIVICGSGVGVNIAANKVRGIRASTGINVDEVRHARKHDNLNVLAVSSDYCSLEVTQEMITAFITVQFEPKERFLRRLKKITDYESLS